MREGIQAGVEMTTAQDPDARLLLAEEAGMADMLEIPGTAILALDMTVADPDHRHRSVTMIAAIDVGKTARIGARHLSKSLTCLSAMEQMFQTSSLSSSETYIRSTLRGFRVSFIRMG